MPSWSDIEIGRNYSLTFLYTSALSSRLIGEFRTFLANFAFPFGKFSNGEKPWNTVLVSSGAVLPKPMRVFMKVWQIGFRIRRFAETKLNALLYTGHISAWNVKISPSDTFENSCRSRWLSRTLMLRGVQRLCCHLHVKICQFLQNFPPNIQTTQNIALRFMGGVPRCPIKHCQGMVCFSYFPTFLLWASKN